MRKPILLLPLILFLTNLRAQMWTGQDTLYGPEWIVEGQAYLRIPVAEDGLYAISLAELEGQGWPVEAVTAGQWRLYLRGEEQPLDVRPGELRFYGRKNRGELDRYLFRDAAAQQLNPEYSLVGDTAVYFLTWSEAAVGLRFTPVENDLTNPPAAQPWVWRTSERVITDHFIKESYRFSGATLQYSHYSTGEGYGSRSFNNLLQNGGTTQTVSLETPHAYGAGPSPKLSARYTAGLGNHQQQLTVNGELVHAAAFDNWRVVQVDTLLAQPLGNTTDLNWEGLADEKDEVSIAYARLRYPAEPTAAGAAYWRFSSPASGDEQYLELPDLEGAAAATVYDLTNRLRLEATLEDGLLRVVLPPSALERELLVVTDAYQVQEAAPLPVDWALPDLAGVEFLILTHPDLRAGSEDQVAAYAQHRASALGGGYQTAIVDVRAVYERFGYGLDYHPQAIRNFVHWLKREEPAFRFLFIVGKGREYTDVRAAADLQAALGNSFFVPAFGYPASDNLLAATNESATPIVAVGRLAAVDPSEVALYLDKVVALEEQTAAGQTIAEQSWKKNVLHLGGGNTASEQQSIRSLLENMGDLLGRSTFGARITPFYKTSTDPIQTSQSEGIFGRINEGVSIITFFGHSSAGTFDFSIDNPSNYNNYGKCPLMLSLGCYSGDMFNDFRSVGERFVLLEDAGAIAFGASRGIGFIHALGTFARQYYDYLGGDYYTQTIGQALRATIDQFTDFNDIAYGTLKEQFSLHGDPAIRLNISEGEDYTPDPASVKFEPPVVNVQRDSFSFSVDVYNLGVNREDSLNLKVEQQLPNGELVAFPLKRIATPAYAETVDFTLPTLGKASVGLNSLFLTVDSDDEISEMPAPAAEQNNALVRGNGQAGVPLYVVDNTAQPVWPPRYGLVGDANITLKASTADALAPERTYVFQLDTTPHFEQPLAMTSLTQRGGVLRWAPDLGWRDSTVYYWRVSPDSSETVAGFVWEESSFTFIEGIAAGWGQAHWGQYAENALTNMEVERREQLDFVNDFRDLYIRNNIYSLYSSDFRAYGFVNGRRWSDFFRWNVHPSIQVVVVDTLGDFWRNENPGEYGSVNTSTTVAIAAFSFPISTTDERANVITFLEDIVPLNHTIVVYNALRTPEQDMWIDEWEQDSLALDGKNLFNVLESAGATQIRDLRDGDMRPYLFSYVKGGGTIHEELAPTFDATIQYNLAIPGYFTEGSMSSQTIGPARQWDRLFWRALQETPDDTVAVKLTALSTSGEEWILLDTTAFNGTLDIGTLDAGTYPFLRLEFAAEDRYETTCPELAYWRIHYQGLPDLALQTGAATIPDSLPRGAPLPQGLEVVNVTDRPMEETQATIGIRSDAGETTWNQTVPALGPEEVYALELPDTKDLRGLTQFIAEVNPQENPAEVRYTNNQGVLNFQVEEERIQPAVDVTFDGRKILEGDIVSARPYVQLAITDENPYLLLSDTSLFELDVVAPDGQRRRIALDGREAFFFPALSAEPNEARIEWLPEFTESGTYRLQLLAKDASNNPAGRLLYETSFEVITEQMISHFLPYPNPFTTQTRFVYTLTGDRPPADIFVQIMTVSGRVVREITQSELGPLQVGTHQTEFVWDGTDAYGDRLANGVYLFRVVARDEQGAALPIYDNGSTDFFANGLGKIVILR